PAAVSTGIGSQVQRPLAVVVVAGMLIGPVMLLVVAPALQVVFLGRSREVTQPDGQGRAPIELHQEQGRALGERRGGHGWGKGMAPRAFPYVAQAPQAPQPAQTARKWQVTRNLHIPGPVYPAGAEGTQRPRIARSGREGLNDTHCCRALLLKAALERPRNEETRAAAGPRQLPNSGARCERGSAVAPTLFLVRPEDIPLRQ